MNNIITDNSNAEHTISSKVDTFFSNFSISKLMKKSNFYKEGGIQCVVVLKEIFGVVFSGKNLYRTLKMNPDDVSFKKNTAYRFLNSSSYNWARLLLLLVIVIIEGINKLTSEDRSDGTTFLTVAFSLLSSRHEKKILCPVDSKVNKRSAGYEKRAEATVNATETFLKLLDSVKGLPTKLPAL